jgi:diguanylate cyclase (GGDEF)-like protein
MRLTRLDQSLGSCDRSPRDRAGGRTLWVLLWGVLAIGLVVPRASAVDPDAAPLLRRADSIKLADYAQFSGLLQSLERRRTQLKPAEQEYLDYLEGWNGAYAGRYDAAVAALGKLVDHARDPTVRFRADATVVNVLSVSKRYEEAFSRLNQLLALLMEVSDKQARQQALLVAALTYISVGQYDLALRYSQMVIEESPDARGACRGSQPKLEALYLSKKLTAVEPELQAGIDACEKAGEPMFANTIRTYAAKLQIDEARYDEAIALLKQHYADVVQSRYTRLISAYDALLAEAYHRKGVPSLARQFGLDTLQSAPPHEYTEPLVNAYAVLYELAKGEGDFKAALAYHEQYAAADKAYLDDVSARQVDALNKQNHVLELERQLGAKAVEASRLYIALLILIALFIGMWAYRTKRSQLHFMQLSRLDGLTGISNRPHFIAQAQKALESGGKMREPLSIALCDLDHFKTVNDRHGHATGDYVLKRVVMACKAHLHAADIFGRFGGEEFGFVFPACGPSEARRRSEQLRAAIAAISTKMDDVELNVSASFGIAATSASGYELRQLLAHADTALYEAKRAGRNRVVLHESAHIAAPHAERSHEERTRDLPETKRIVGG